MTKSKSAPAKNPGAAPLPKFPFEEFRKYKAEDALDLYRKYKVLEAERRFQLPNLPWPDNGPRANMDWSTLTVRHGLEPLDVPIKFLEPFVIQPKYDPWTITIHGRHPKKIVIRTKTSFRLYLSHGGRRDEWSKENAHSNLPWWLPFSGGHRGSINGIIRCPGGFVTANLQPVSPGEVAIYSLGFFFPYKMPASGLGGSLDEPLFIPALVQKSVGGASQGL